MCVRLVVDCACAVRIAGLPRLWSSLRINRLLLFFLNTSSRCFMKDFTARRRRTNSENKKRKEKRRTGDMFRVEAEAAQTPSFLF